MEPTHEAHPTHPATAATAAHTGTYQTPACRLSTVQLFDHWGGHEPKERKFPRRWLCPKCNGKAGWNRNPCSSNGPNYDYHECPECNGEGYLYSPETRVIRRYVASLIHRGKAA